MKLDDFLTLDKRATMRIFNGLVSRDSLWDIYQVGQIGEPQYVLHIHDNYKARLFLRHVGESQHREVDIHADYLFIVDKPGVSESYFVSGGYSYTVSTHLSPRILPKRAVYIPWYRKTWYYIRRQWQS